MSVAISAWAVTDHLANIPTRLFLDEIYNKLAFIFAYIAVYAGLRFSYYFVSTVKKRTIEQRITIPIGLAIVILSGTVYIAGNVSYVKGNLDFSVGKLVILYVLSMLFMLGLITRNLLSASKRGDNRTRQQAKLILFGFSTAVILGLIANIIIPTISKNWDSTDFGPLLTVILVSSITYAIIKHKLFDIRLIVARSLAYVFTLITIALIYIIPVILLTTYIIHQSLSTTSIVALVVVTFIVAIIFHPLRIRFNKLTNSLFFRDYYEPQEILDQLSTVLVGSVEVKHIENSSTKILINTFRPQFLKFLFMSEPESNQGNQEIIKIMKSFKDNVLFVDEIKSDHNRVIYGSSYDKPIAVAIRLSTSNQDLGYLLLGYKESGNIYNNVDKRLLGIAADEIAISLQNALRFKEIQQFNITLQAKVDEATKELKKTNEKLKALDETKDDFISMASHQLRTPLAIIKGYVNMLVHGDAGKLNKQQKDFLDQASISSETMVRLVTSLLNVSRITSGKFSVESNPVNLADIVENEVLQLSNMAKERNIQLTYQKPNDFPILMLDEEKIRQVVANFIDNAIHYSKDKGAKINVQLTDNDDIIFEVIDNGIGVPPNEKEHLFTKFYRAKNAKEARPNGTGVGIYLAKVVINELGGDLVFESKEGIGSTFGFRFKKDKIVQPVSKS